MVKEVAEGTPEHKEQGVSLEMMGGVGLTRLMQGRCGSKAGKIKPMRSRAANAGAGR